MLGRITIKTSGALSRPLIVALCTSRHTGRISNHNRYMLRAILSSRVRPNVYKANVMKLFPAPWLSSFLALNLPPLWVAGQFNGLIVYFAYYDVDGGTLDRSAAYYRDVRISAGWCCTLYLVLGCIGFHLLRKQQSARSFVLLYILIGLIYSIFISFVDLAIFQGFPLVPSGRDLFEIAGFSINFLIPGLLASFVWCWVNLLFFRSCVWKKREPTSPDDR